MTSIRACALLLAALAALASPLALAQSEGKRYTVSPGMSIQATIDKAAPGDTVQVLPGVYNEALQITTNNIHLIGLNDQGNRTVLNGTTDSETLFWAIAVATDDVTVEGFVIRDYSAGGLVADNLKNLTLRDLIIRRTGDAGVYTDDVAGLTIERVVASEVSGLAIGIMESTDITIKDTEAFLSPYGLVLIECIQTHVENSSFYQNAVGIVVATHPDPQKQSTDFTKILHCRVLDNNGENTLDSDQFHIPAPVPGGIGIAIVGADHTEVAESIIAGNGSCAIATYGHPDAAMPENHDGEASTPGIPDHTYVHHNTYADNGAAPSKAYTDQFKDIPPCDLYWDGTGVRNQWQESTDLKTHPENLVVEHGGVHTEVIHFL